MRYLFIILILVIGTCRVSFSQNASEQQKREALIHIKNGRFGEAIDLLNKYVAANPRVAEGYNLRALCFEKRKQYGDAVLDLRRAVKLVPNNKEIQQSLARIEKAWYALLYKKIEGHKREIAINSGLGVNYLEIGKCMKDLGKWADAETWYDEFLKREDASPDEVIRYSEILAHNNHIGKGEKILKTYTERYPNDQRLWSRYGFFSMWLGKNKIAIKAFENALAIKPFFKEAQDGLDQAKGKPYLFEWTDTTARYRKTPKPQEYAIDKYFKVLKNKPEDDATRYLLVNELLQKERIEEAYQQVQLLSVNHSGEEKFQALFDSVISVRSNFYKQKISECQERLSKNPKDKESVKKLAWHYVNLSDYENAKISLSNYLSGVSENEDDDVRFLFAKILAWNREFENAIEPLNILLNKDPENPDYQLLRGQIGVWTDQDFELAEKYLTNVAQKQPNNLDPLVALGSLYIKLKQMDTARQYLDRAKSMDPEHHNVKELQIYYDFRVLAIEEEKIFEILTEGRELAVKGDYQASLEKYNEYLSKISNPSRLVLAEYAEINAVAKNHSKAIEVYDQLLSQEYDFDIDLMRAKTYLWGADSTIALQEFKKLYAASPDNYDVQFYLAEAHERMRDYEESRLLLENLLTKTTDSSKVELIKQRLSWLPVTGIRGILSTFPNYIGISPQFSYYWDNQGFLIKNTLGTLDLGITSFLTIGATFSRGTIQGDYQYSSIQRNFTVLKGNIHIKPSKMFSLYGGIGNLTYQGLKNRLVKDAGFRLENEKHFRINGFYESTDAGIMLYSPYLVRLMDKDPNQYRITADRYKISGYYLSSLGLRASGHFSYIKLTDENSGNDFQIRLGRQFMTELFAGYEYNFINYAKSKSLKINRDFYYYSPRNFESHSIWAEWDLNKVDDFTINVGGRIGYVPANDFILREITGDFSYQPFRHLMLTATITAGGTYRNDSSYNYLSTYISAYFSF